MITKEDIVEVSNICLEYNRKLFKKSIKGQFEFTCNGYELIVNLGNLLLCSDCDRKYDEEKDKYQSWRSLIKQSLSQVTQDLIKINKTFNRI